MLPSKKQPERDERKKRKMEKLKKLVERENNKELKKAISNLKKVSSNDIINLWYYREKLTKRQFEKVQNNELTTKTTKELIYNKIVKEYKNRLTKNIKKIDMIQQTNNDINTINISINWVKSKTWGNNPHATITTDAGQLTEGRASGCGYDKESAAIAEALNKNNDILKLLYVAKNKKMTLKNTNNHDILGYGSGYGVLPYFEGGVGVSSLMNIFKKLGYNVTEYHTEKSDFYTITKGGQR